jgi:hypothetical protein
MAEYLVKLADERGHIQEKTESGHSESEVRERYSQAGFLVYSVKARGGVGSFRLPFGRKVKPQQFLIFNQQFLTLIRAGLPIVQSMELLMRRQRNEYFRKILEDVRDRLKGGALLSEAFEAQQVFPKIYTTTLLAGEKSGNLEEVVGRYISFQRLLLTFRKKLVASLIYPSILVVGVIVLFTMLITWVVPRFAALFNDQICLGVRRECAEVGSGNPAGAGAGGDHFCALEEVRGRIFPVGPFYAFVASLRANLDEVASGDLFAHAFNLAEWRVAPGAFAGDGGGFDWKQDFGAWHSRGR